MTSTLTADGQFRHNIKHHHYECKPMSLHTRTHTPPAPREHTGPREPAGRGPRWLRPAVAVVWVNQREGRSLPSPHPSSLAFLPCAPFSRLLPPPLPSLRLCPRLCPGRSRRLAALGLAPPPRAGPAPAPPPAGPLPPPAPPRNPSGSPRWPRGGRTAPALGRNRLRRPRRARTGSGDALPAPPS